jgi:hypothetical protein
MEICIGHHTLAFYCRDMRKTFTLDGAKRIHPDGIPKPIQTSKIIDIIKRVFPELNDRIPCV